MTQETLPIVFDEQGLPATLRFVEWKEWNIRPSGKLHPIYEWKLSSTPFVIPARWIVSLPSSTYLTYLKASAEELDPADLPHDTVWDICTGDLSDERKFKGSLSQAKNLLLSLFLEAFEYEPDPRRRKKRGSPGRVFVRPVN